MSPLQIAKDFDEFLMENGESFSAIIIGAAALSILGVISRQTQDIDVLDPNIPVEIKELAEKFQKAQIKKGIRLDSNWLNNGPSSITEILSPGWKSRLQTVFAGKALTLTTLSRIDLLGTKLDAMCQRGDDFDDIVKMKPTREELLEAAAWVRKQDANPDWPTWVEKQALKVAKALGYAL